MSPVGIRCVEGGCLPSPDPVLFPISLRSSPRKHLSPCSCLLKQTDENLDLSTFLEPLQTMLLSLVLFLLLSTHCCGDSFRLQLWAHWSSSKSSFLLPRTSIYGESSTWDALVRLLTWQYPSSPNFSLSIETMIRIFYFKKKIQNLKYAGKDIVQNNKEVWGKINTIPYNNRSHSETWHTWVSYTLTLVSLRTLDNLPSHDEAQSSLYEMSLTIPPSQVETINIKHTLHTSCLVVLGSP